MPAVTVQDIMVLPRVNEPDPAVATDRQVLAVTNSYPEERLAGALRVVESLVGVDLEALRLLI